MNENITAIKDKILDIIPQLAKDYGPKLLLSIAIVVVGLWVLRKVEKLLSKVFEKAGIPNDISPFLVSVLIVTLKIFLFLSAAGVLGFDATSLIAVLAAAGFAIGMALQGSLANFAAGIMILLFKPYKVGEIVEIQGQMGEVTEIQIFNTIVTTFDNRTTIIPNGIAISDIITNLSEREYVRVELQVHMPYAEDFERVEKVILETLKSTPHVLEEPTPFVGINQWDSHNLILDVMPYAKTKDYWSVYYESYRRIKKAMSENNVKVAYSEGVELGPIGK